MTATPKTVEDAPSRASTEQEVQAWVGVRLDAGLGEVEAERGYVHHWMEATENGNPIYWDQNAMHEVVGRAIVPPSMLSVWMRPLMFKPGHAEMIRPLELHFKLKDAIGLAKGIVASNDITFGEPVEIGDRVRTVQTVRSISPTKTISLGTGRFWTLDVTYTNQRDEVVGIESYDFFCYS
ncbi:MAG: acyl dehydratase [Glaciecola sp.]|jgi:acyl dehydratase